MENQSLQKDYYSKKKYQSPTLTIEFIEMEEGISAGSATTSPTNSGGDLVEEWETSDNDERSMDW
ncbi:hypothetical protein CMT19_16680 [Elizabethkingia anophelis]|nr:hypothetical protein [Elizabethkingia anophelis]